MALSSVQTPARPPRWLGRGTLRACDFSGPDYRILDAEVTAEDALLAGHLQSWQVQPGLWLHGVEARDLRTMSTRSPAVPGLHLVVLLEGCVDVAFGSQGLQMQVAPASPAVPMRRPAAPSSIRGPATCSCGIGGAASSSASSASPCSRNVCRPGPAYGRATAAAALDGAAVTGHTALAAIAARRGGGRADHPAGRAKARRPCCWPAARWSWCPRQCRRSTRPSPIRRRPCRACWACANTGAWRASRPCWTAAATAAARWPEIAREVGLSASACSAQFRLAYGSSIDGYRREQRLERAWAALEQTGCSVSEVAHAAGYSSAANFSTAFKRRFGTLSQAGARQALRALMGLWARCANVGGAGANPAAPGDAAITETKGHPSMTQLQARTSVRMDRAEEAIAAIVGHMQEHDITVRREGTRWVADYEGGRGQLWLEGRQSMPRCRHRRGAAAGHEAHAGPPAAGGHGRRRRLPGLGG